jgi:transcriptional regulator with XRE-family HTH domain
MSTELWQRLRAARKAAGLTQEELGRRIGVTRASVSQWEAPEKDKRTIPRWEHIASVSAVTGAPQDWLMSDESELESFWFAPDDHDGDGKPELPHQSIMRKSEQDPLGMWSAFVVVPRLDPDWTRDARRTLSQASLGLLAYKRSWVEFKQLDPGNLYTWVASDDSMDGCGIHKGDNLLIDSGQRSLSVSGGLYLVGASRTLLELRIAFNGSKHLQDVPAHGPVSITEVTPEVEEAVIGRAILHVREV